MIDPTGLQAAPSLSWSRSSSIQSRTRLVLVSQLLTSNVDGMAGPNLEIFKFGLYVFFPVAILVHYGNPVWYQKHVIPVRDIPFLVDLILRH